MTTCGSQTFEVLGEQYVAKSLRVYRDYSRKPSHTFSVGDDRHSLWTLQHGQIGERWRLFMNGTNSEPCDALEGGTVL